MGALIPMMLPAGLPIMLPLLMLAILLYPLVRRVCARRFEPFELLVIVIAGIFLGFVVRPLVIALLHDFEFYDPSWGLTKDETVWSYNLAMWYGILGTLALVLAYESGLAKRIGASLPVVGNSWGWTRARYPIVIMSLLSLASLVLLGRLLGTGWSYWEILQIGQRVEHGGLYYVIEGVKLIVLANLLWCVAANRLGWLFFAHFTLTVLVLLALGQRSFLISYALSVAVVYNFRHKRISLPVLAVLGCIAVVYLQAWDQIRYYLAWSGKSFIEAARMAWDYYADESVGILDSLLFSGLLSYFDYFAIILYLVPRYWEFQPGYSLMALLAAPVPRALWEEKPIVLGAKFSQQFDIIQPQTPGISFWGELYINGGLLVIVSGMILVGLAFGVAYQYFRANSENKGAMLIYAVFCGSFFMIRSVLSSTVIVFLSQAIPLILALLWLSRGSIVIHPLRRHFRASIAASNLLPENR